MLGPQAVFYRSDTFYALNGRGYRFNSRCRVTLFVVFEAGSKCEAHPSDLVERPELNALEVIDQVIPARDMQSDAVTNTCRDPSKLARGTHSLAKRWINPPAVLDGKSPPWALIRSYLI